MAVICNQIRQYGAGLIWLVVGLLAAVPVFSAPSRVVSMNLCLDQLAMMIAAPGQLLSVSYLAQDPRLSPMADTARQYPANYGRAEEIYLMQPDLVIAGQYESSAPAQMLRRLGVRVEVMRPAESIDQIREDIQHIGQLLGRTDAAGRLLTAFDRELARAKSPVRRGRVALYYANGFTSGSRTLAGAILAMAGYGNVAEEYGVSLTAPLPMELLLMSQPDMLITGAKWPGRSRSEAVLDHPALSVLRERGYRITDRNWICGTPDIVSAVRALQ